jgi:epoxyqueuosine reductase QueG
MISSDKVIEFASKLGVDACAEGALDGTTVNQQICRKPSFYKNERGFDIYACSNCRQVCPLRLGKKN